MVKHETRLSSLEAIALGFVPREKKAIYNGNPRYQCTDQQLEQLAKIRELQKTEFREVKRTLNEKGKVVSKVEKLSPKKLIDIPLNHEIKRVSTNVSTQQQWVITEPIKELKADLEKIDFTKFFKRKITPITYVYDSVNKDGFDRLVYSDAHIGMEVNKDGFALYDGTWNEKELNHRLEIMVKWTLQHKKYDDIYISDLGDLMDGWDGLTTRKEHHLPQNMDNQKSFDVALTFKIKMIESFVGAYDKIVCNCITDDNHSGAFSYVVNSAFKNYIELKYPNNVKVNIQRKFIDHYLVMDKFCFIECHGKDGGNMKFGFKPQLDDKQIKIISNYIDENFLSKKDLIVEFNKGDSHQSLIDKSSSKKFQYHNFPSLAPPSNWVKTNFQNSMSGFSFRNYYLNGQMSNHDYIF